MPMRFPCNIFFGLLIGCSLAYIVSIGDAQAETLSMQEALIELNEAVQFYQVGDRTQALQTLLSITTDPVYPQSIQQEANNS